MRNYPIFFTVAAFTVSFSSFGNQALCPSVNETLQNICQAMESDFPKIKHLQAQDNGGGVEWYADNSSMTAFSSEAYLVDGAVYYLGSPDGTCVGNRIAVTVSIAESPNAGRTTFLTFNSDDDPIDLRTVINTTYLRPEPDPGGFITPLLESGTTIFHPSIDANHTGQKQYQHNVASQNEICDDDTTIVYIKIVPQEYSDHRLILIGETEEEAKTFFDSNLPPASPEGGIMANIWLDLPLDIGGIYLITINGQSKYYYINNVFQTPNLNPNLTLTSNTPIVKLEFTDEEESNPPILSSGESSLQLERGKKYLVSAWVSEDFTTPKINYASSHIEINFDSSTPLVFSPSGEIIDNWQRIVGEFEVPLNAQIFNLKLQSLLADGSSYFDDIRILPINAAMKSFVYDPENQRLVAELDENNFSTFYEYDQEGGLIRIKKETERGIYTVQETRSGNSIISSQQ